MRAVGPSDESDGGELGRGGVAANGAVGPEGGVAANGVGGPADGVAANGEGGPTGGMSPGDAGAPPGGVQRAAATAGGWRGWWRLQSIAATIASATRISNTPAASNNSLLTAEGEEGDEVAALEASSAPCDPDPIAWGLGDAGGDAALATATVLTVLVAGEKGVAGTAASSVSRAATCSATANAVLDAEASSAGLVGALVGGSTGGGSSVGVGTGVSVGTVVGDGIRLAVGDGFRVAVGDGFRVAVGVDDPTVTWKISTP